MGDLASDLTASSEELIETHISWVFLRPGEVFKVKKPVDFGFLDFTDAAARKAACLAEVELNSRLAPGVYRGVVPVLRDSRGVHHVGSSPNHATGDAGTAPSSTPEWAGQGEVVDYAVHMNRLPRAARADLLLERGELGAAHIDALAGCLARFHARAAQGEHIAEFGRVQVIRGNVEENFAQARSLLSQLVPGDVEREVEERQLGFLASHAPLFAQRIGGGYIRDGHGDLRLEHAYMVDSGGPVIIDCIEFNERFRFADVCADVAFLSMDLRWHGRVDLAERLLARYARETGDHDLYALVDFYESYRAYVRAKVSALSLGSASLSFDARQRLEAEARGYLLLSLASERPALRAARLIAMGGMIASGKSSIAEALGTAMGAIVIGSDETRKRLHGVQPTTPLHDAAWQSTYSLDATQRVYSELLRRAQVVLQSGRSVIIDATFRSRADRAAARRLAATTGAVFTFVECRASDAVARARLASRARGPSVSDGRLEIYDDFAARYEPATELAPSEYVLVDTSGTVEESMERLSRAGLDASES